MSSNTRISTEISTSAVREQPDLEPESEKTGCKETETETENPAETKGGAKEVTGL